MGEGGGTGPLPTTKRSSVLVRNCRELNSLPAGTGVRFDVRPMVRGFNEPAWGVYNGKIEDAGTEVHSFVQRDYSHGPKGQIFEYQCGKEAISYWRGMLVIDSFSSRKIVHDFGSDLHTDFDRMLEEIGR